jgi:outer membrane murein-binding lipoprotein Lpp
MKLRVIFASVVASAVLAASTPQLASAQAPTVEQLTARIGDLERRVADLEQRIRALQGVQAAARPERPAVSGSSLDIGNWRRLDMGMTMPEVSRLLGEPVRVDALGNINWLYQSGGMVTFDPRSKKVQGWQEPSR